MHKQQRESDSAAELAALPKGILRCRASQCRVNSALLALQAIHCYSREAQSVGGPAHSVDDVYSMATPGTTTTSARFVRAELQRPQQQQALNLLMPAISRGYTVIMVHAAKSTFFDVGDAFVSHP